MNAHAMLLASIFLIYGILHETYGLETPSDSTFRKLRQYLFKDHDASARPVNHHDNKTEVKLDFTPLHIADVDENTGIMTMECWVFMTWTDEHNKWEPENFSGLKTIRVPENNLWKPDITVYNGQGEHVSPWNKMDLILFSNGVVIWVPSATVRLICGPFDYSNYPKDTQECKLTLGSWTNDGYQVDMQLKSANVSMQEFSKNSNPHWELLSVTGTRDVKYYECCTEPYVSVTYRMKIKRTNVPFSALCSTPETVARLLFLCMFWISTGIGKFLVGCSSLLILSVLSVGVTLTVPSPAAVTVALSTINSAFALGVAALIVELLVVAISTFNLASPGFVEGLYNSTFGQLLVPCNDEQTKDSLIDTSAGNPSRKNYWPFVSVLIDRVAFAAFAVLLACY